MKDAYVEAAGLSLATRTGPVFTDLDFALPKGRLTLVAGRSGTGRSALLLALAGRMRGLTGTLRVAGFDATSQSKQVRANVAVARIARLIDLEGQLTVADCVTERALTDAVKPARATGVFAHAERILDHTFDRAVLVDELPALDRTLLSVALATLRPAHVLVLDDADRGLTADELVSLLDALDRLAETSVTVVASVLDADAAPVTATVVTLHQPSTTVGPRDTGPDHTDHTDETEATDGDADHTTDPGDQADPAEEAAPAALPAPERRDEPQVEPTSPRPKHALIVDELTEVRRAGSDVEQGSAGHDVDDYPDDQPHPRRSRTDATPTTPPPPPTPSDHTTAASPATPSTL